MGIVHVKQSLRRNFQNSNKMEGFEKYYICFFCRYHRKI